MKDLIKYKKEKKKKNPDFVRQDIHKKKRLAKTWRKPRGEHSKMRLRMDNHYLVTPGYGTPKELRHTVDGLKIKHVSSMKELEGLDPKKDAVIVSGRLGLRKKIPMLNELMKKEITILNIKDPKEYIKQKQAKLEEKRNKRQAKDTKKETKKEKETIEEKLSDEEKKKLEKKEIDKLLTKKV